MSPVAEALQLTAVPTVPVAGHVMVVTSGEPPPIVMVADADAVFALESVPVTLTVYVPLTAYVVVKLDPVPLDGEPPVAVQLKVYGVVPPVPVAVKVTAVPVVPAVGPETETVKASGEIATVADADAVTAFASVAATLMAYDPLTA